MGEIAGGASALHRIRIVANDSDIVRVLVADDHPVFREGIVRALAANPRASVVAETGDGRSALEAIASELPDVALLDYRLPGLDGIEIVRAVVRDGLSTRVLMLSAHDESSVVYDALQAGAAGYLLKEASRDEIVAAVLAVARGESVLPAEVGAGLVGEIRLRSPSETLVLTQREREIMRLIANGKSFPEIASALFIGVTTVKTHAQHVYEKLGVSDRAAAVAEAMRRHLIE
jgi:two-component system, NarL family, nitrate/nitrite response regulator NarL